MFGYKKFMKEFEGDMLDVVLEPDLNPGEKELVQVKNVIQNCFFRCLIVTKTEISKYKI